MQNCRSIYYKLVISSSSLFWIEELFWIEDSINRWLHKFQLLHTFAMIIAIFYFFCNNFLLHLTEGYFNLTILLIIQFLSHWLFSNKTGLFPGSYRKWGGPVCSLKVAHICLLEGAYLPRIRVSTPKGWFVPAQFLILYVPVCPFDPC